MIEIAFLADHVDVIPTLSQWFRAQWPDYFATRTVADIARDFYVEAQRTGLPVRLVALVGAQLAGTVCLRERALASLPAYRPGLGGLFVADRYRGRGVGSELVKAGMDLARAQGYEHLYATTEAARGLLERLGWVRVQLVPYGDELLALYQCDLEVSGR